VIRIEEGGLVGDERTLRGTPRLRHATTLPPGGHLVFSGDQNPGEIMNMARGDSHGQRLSIPFADGFGRAQPGSRAFVPHEQCRTHRRHTRQIPGRVQLQFSGKQ
jgi:hypothetical protein